MDKVTENKIKSLQRQLTDARRTGDCEWEHELEEELELMKALVTANSLPMKDELRNY